MCKSSCLSIFLVALSLPAMVQVSGFGDYKRSPIGVADGTLFAPKTISLSDAHLDQEHYMDKRDAETDYRYYYRQERGGAKVSTCTPEFSKIAGHTMCLVDNPKVSRSGLTPPAVKFIVHQHNRFRGMVNPPATDLPRMVWNRRLARVAQKWANQCKFAHDHVRQLPGVARFIGQNVAGGHKSWRLALQAWYDEIKLFRYGEDPKVYIGDAYLRKVGHFTQIVSNATVQVGCGFAQCPNTEYERFYVCNYLAGQSQLIKPYTRGRRCAKCPNNCRNGVCDCGGKFCRNLGKLNLNTCKCECTELYRGAVCSQLVCPPADKIRCKKDAKPSFCKKYVNIPIECPYMCGVCTDKDRQFFEKLPTGRPIKVHDRDYVKTRQGCWFYGVLPSKAKCLTYGNKGMDSPEACKSFGGKFGCPDCHIYSNVAKQYCPVMCGICEAPCHGKSCNNKGSLDRKTCKCKCKKPFGGELCEKVFCPKSDPEKCRRVPNGGCQQFHNVREMCPYLCKVCKK